MELVFKELQHFLNENMQLIALPAKYKKQLIAFYYLADKIVPQKIYSEIEINEELNKWTLFGDPATLRRQMVEKRLLNRTNDCRSYWKEENIPALEDFIAQNI